jgi:hypothetical protein
MGAREFRSATLASLLAALGVAGVLGLTFGVLLHPLEVSGCNTSLPDSDFRTALAPVHVLAGAVLSGRLWVLSARRPRGGLPGRPTLLGLVAVWAYVGASQRPDDSRWSDHARSAQFLLWGALLLGLPASLAYAWLTGAKPFCF